MLERWGVPDTKFNHHWFSFRKWIPFAYGGFNQDNQEKSSIFLNLNMINELYRDIKCLSNEEKKELKARRPDFKIDKGNLCDRAIFLNSVYVVELSSRSLYVDTTDSYKNVTLYADSRISYFREYMNWRIQGLWIWEVPMLLSKLDQDVKSIHKKTQDEVNIEEFKEKFSQRDIVKELDDFYKKSD